MDWRENLQQLIDSKSYIDFTQGVDIRLMTEEKAEYFKRMRISIVHFAWDRYEDKDIIVPKFKAFKSITGWYRQKMRVYCLVNFNTTHEQDLERIYTLRDLGYDPYVMVYDKEHTHPKDFVRRLQRWVNAPQIFHSTKTFEEYYR